MLPTITSILSRCGVLLVVILWLAGTGHAIVQPVPAKVSVGVAQPLSEWLNRPSVGRVEKRVLALYYPWYRTPVVSGKWAHQEGVEPVNKRMVSHSHYPLGSLIGRAGGTGEPFWAHWRTKPAQLRKRYENEPFLLENAPDRASFRIRLS